MAEGVTAVLRRLDALTARPTVRVGDILDAFGPSAFLPAMMVPALIVLSPLSGIPLLPTVFGTMIALTAIQALVGRQGLWLPAALRGRRLSGPRLHGALVRLVRVAGWLDDHARDRLRPLVRPPLDAVPKALCAVSGGAMPFLELVPFSSSILAAAVLFFTTALLVEDGLYVVGGAILVAGAAMVPLLVYGGVLGLTG